MELDLVDAVDPQDLVPQWLDQVRQYWNKKLRCYQDLETNPENAHKHQLIARAIHPDP